MYPSFEKTDFSEVKNMSQEEDEAIETQSPLITYTNRLQKQMLYVTMLLHNQHTQEKWGYEVKKPMLGIVANLPPEADQALKQEIALLQSDKILSFAEINRIYRNIHNWTYRTLFQKAFHFIGQREFEKMEKEEDE